MTQKIVPGSRDTYKNREETLLKVFPPNFKITVAVVCLNEETNIASCLNSLLHQSHRPKNYEILVVDNGSTDATTSIIKKIQKKSKCVRLIFNSKPGIAASRNCAVKNTTGELLAFIDADCIAPRHWLSHLIRGFHQYHQKDPRVIAVGGANRPPQDTTFNKSLGLILNSFLGSRGSVQGRRYLKDRYVPHLPCVNVFFLKQAIKKTGYFDETFGNIIEDEDLTFRLSQKGYRFVYLTHATVIHRVARSYRSWAKKMFIYGKGRIWFLQKYPQKWHLFFLLPIFLVATAPLTSWLYFPLIFFSSLILVTKAKKPFLLTRVVLFYLITHYLYGLGEIYGFFVKKPSQ